MNLNSAIWCLERDSASLPDQLAVQRYLCQHRQQNSVIAVPDCEVNLGISSPPQRGTKQVHRAFFAYYPQRSGSPPEGAHIALRLLEFLPTTLCLWLY